jgi:Pyruvate/2-oxoacid:ferredoxin oxidoreductase delta subunit
MAVRIIKDKCIMCGVCIIKCPERAIGISEKKAFVIANICNNCQVCVGKCLNRAIVYDPVNCSQRGGQ